MTRKRRLASSALWPLGDTEDDASRLQKMLADGVGQLTQDPIQSAMAMMFKRDNYTLPQFGSDGSLTY